MKIVFRPVVLPALLLALALLAFLPSAAGAGTALEQHCPTTACQTPSVQEHVPGHDTCPTTYSCHPTVEHHHGPGGIVILAGTPVIAVPHETPGGVSAPTPLTSLPSAEGPERPPRFTR